jgi:hypothetical protein
VLLAVYINGNGDASADLCCTRQNKHIRAPRVPPCLSANVYVIVAVSASLCAVHCDLSSRLSSVIVCACFVKPSVECHCVRLVCQAVCRVSLLCRVSLCACACFRMALRSLQLQGHTSGALILTQIT